MDDSARVASGRRRPVRRGGDASRGTVRPGAADARRRRPAGRPGGPPARVLALPRHPQGPHGHARSSASSAAAAGGSRSRRTTGRSTGCATTSAPARRSSSASASSRGTLKRLIVDPFVALANRVSGPVDQTVTFAEANLQLNLTGGKTWHRLAPFVGSGVGLTFPSGTPADTSGFELGKKIYLAPFDRRSDSSSPTGSRSGARPGPCSSSSSIPRPSRTSRRPSPAFRPTTRNAVITDGRGQRVDHQLGARRRARLLLLALIRMAASLSRVVGFRARHRSSGRTGPRSENREAFGPLSEAPGHAHDYHCVVTVRGPTEATRGMVMDLAVLDRVLQDEVVAPLDGKHLNLRRAGVRRRPDAADLRGHRRARLPPRGRPSSRRRELQRVRILEDPTLYADCTGLP